MSFTVQMIRTLLAMIAAQALLAYLHKWDVYPELWAADMLGIVAPDPTALFSIGLCIAALIAIVVTVFLEAWGWPRLRAVLAFPLKGSEHLTGQVGQLSAAPSAADASPARKPDYPRWDAVKVFPLWQAAYLWADEEPRGYPIPVNVQRHLDALGRAARAGELKLIGFHQHAAVADSINAKRHGATKAPDHNWEATRDALRTYAFGVSERPPFLFPRERSGADPNPPPPKPDATVKQAVGFTIDKTWVDDPDFYSESYTDRVEQISSDIRQHALEGELSVWGIQAFPGKAGVHVKIPAEMWEKLELDLLPLLMRPNEEGGAKYPKKDKPEYSDLRVNRAQIERLFE